jgi:hypothetical protein
MTEKENMRWQDYNKQHDRGSGSHPHGQALLDSPTLNRGEAFTLEERREYGLE